MQREPLATESHARELDAAQAEKLAFMISLRLSKLETSLLNLEVLAAAEAIDLSRSIRQHVSSIPTGICSESARGQLLESS